MKTLGKILAVTLVICSSTAAMANEPKFCMKKFLASQQLHANPATNHYAQVQKNNDAIYNNLVDSGIIRRNR